MAEENSNALTRAEILIGLLKEYTVKINDIRMQSSASKTATKAHEQLLEHQFRVYLLTLKQRLDSPLAELIQQTSQLVENAAINPAVRVELRLRLAELEAAHDALNKSSFVL